VKLVEAESTGPVEGEEATVTPPRPPHRRVSVSLLFTLTVLVGTVVAIYVVFPRRDNVLVTAALAQHRTPPAWDITQPTPAELRAWAIGVVGREVPLPAADSIVGASEIRVFDRRAAVMRVAVAGNEVTYLVQHLRGIVPKTNERRDGDLEALAWRRGPYMVVVVGPTQTASAWRPGFP